MAKTNEYLARRCALTEATLVAVGELLVDHFPMLYSQMKEIGAAWDRAIEKLDADTTL